MAAYSPKLQALLAPVVTSMGYELVGVEQHGGGRDGMVRLYIDSEQGVSVDDCARVSHQVSGVMDVEDPVAGNYTLEVSSPGLDRPLFVPEHFERFRGRMARVKLSRPLATGSRKLTGQIQSVTARSIELESDGNACEIAFDQIDSARLIPDYGDLTEKGRTA